VREVFSSFDRVMRASVQKKKPPGFGALAVFLDSVG
jgi:hypothetical protein